MTFKNDIAKFNAKAIAKATLTFRGTALGLFSRIVLRTPVKSGRLRGNWQTQINSAPDSMLDVEDKTGSGVINEAFKKMAKVKLGDSIFFINNLPYALPIEDGSSLQAPAGMVKVTVAEFKAIVRTNT